MKRLLLAVSVAFVAGLGLLAAVSATGSPSPNAGSPAVSRQHTFAGYHQIWSRALDANADSSAIFLKNVHLTGRRTANLVVVVAGNNTSDCDPGNPVRRATTYAFNAVDGKLVWSRSTSGKGRCTTAGAAAAGAWVYAPGLDGRVHRYAAASGTEYRRDGWPKPFTLMPYVEKASSSLRVSGKYLYVATSGFIGDAGHYEGHLVTINLSTGKSHVFNSLCSNIHVLLAASPGARNYCSATQSGMFGRGQAAVDPQSGDVYVVTGNGPWNGSTNWGDSVLKLNPSGTRLLDAFTPRNQSYLNQSDLDLGSSGTAVLPTVKVAGKAYHLATQAGKGPAPSGGPVAIYLLNRDRLGSKPGPGHLGGSLQTLSTPGGGEVLTAPAVWKTAAGGAWVFYGDDSALGGFALRTKGVKRPRLVARWTVRGRFTTPVVSGNVLYVATDGAVEARSPLTGRLLWSSASGSGGTIGSIHWQYPLVAGHMIFMTDENARLYAYKLK